MSRTPRACILSVSGPELVAAEAEFLAEYNPWGLILMGRSCQSPEQLRALIDNIWNALDRACMIFIDQEGGRVQRLGPPHWPEFPAIETFGQLFRISPELAREACFLGHLLIAAELAPLGIYADCAPVLDLRLEHADKVIGDRSFGADPLMIGELGRAALGGLAAGGVAGVIKHIPGHGRAELDSHHALPVVTADLAELEMDMEPFALLNDAPMAMTAHIVYEALDATAPATLSSSVISSAIRARIGFDGLLMSDDLGMAALDGQLGERASAALAAGCDIGLYCAGFCNDPEQILSGMYEVAEACPPLTDKAGMRAEAAEGVTGARHSTELAQERFAELLAMVYSSV